MTRRTLLPCFTVSFFCSFPSFADVQPSWSTDVSTQFSEVSVISSRPSEILVVSNPATVPFFSTRANEVEAHYTNADATTWCGLSRHVRSYVTLMLKDGLATTRRCSCEANQQRHPREGYKNRGMFVSLSESSQHPKTINLAAFGRDQVLRPNQATKPRSRKKC